MALQRFFSQESIPRRTYSLATDGLAQSCCSEFGRPALKHSWASIDQTLHQNAGWVQDSLAGRV
jgi:hypothetical protein